MVFRVFRKVVVPRPNDGVKRDFFRSQSLEHFGLTVGYEPIFGAPDDVDGAAYFLNEAVCSDMVSQQPSDGQQETVARNVVQKGVVRTIHDEHLWPIPGGYPSGKSATERAPVQHNIGFSILIGQPFVNVLKVAEEDLFRSSAPTFSEATEVEYKKIETFAHEVFGKFSPTFYAPRVAFYVKNDPLAVGYPEVERIDHAAIFHVKIDLRKRERVLVREGFGQSFRAKEKKVLSKVEQETQPDIHRGWPKKDIEPKQHLRAKVGRLVAD